MHRRLVGMIIGLALGCSDREPHPPTAVAPAKTQTLKPAGSKLPTIIEIPSKTKAPSNNRVSDDSTNSAARRSPDPKAQPKPAPWFAPKPTRNNLVAVRCETLQHKVETAKSNCSSTNPDACASLTRYQSEMVSSRCEPLKTACVVDEDCVISNSTGGCCASCEPAAVSTHWQQAHENWCNDPYLEPCPEPKCEPQMPRVMARCQENHQCGLVER